MSVFFQNIEKWDLNKSLEELEHRKDNAPAEAAFSSTDHGNIAKLIPILLKVYKNKKTSGAGVCHPLQHCLEC